MQWVIVLERVMDTLEIKGYNAEGECAINIYAQPQQAREIMQLLQKIGNDLPPSIKVIEL